MQTMAELSAAAAQLIESEARSLQRSCARLAAIAAIGVLLLLLGLAGFGFLVAAFYLQLVRWVSPAAAALLVAGCAFLVVMLGALAATRPLWASRPRDPQVVAAAARLKEAIEQLDLLAPLRGRPFATLAIAAAVGALVALSGQTLLAATALTRSLTGLLASVAAIFGREIAGQENKPGPAAPAPTAGD